MNHASQRLLDHAKALAEILASQPAVAAIILGGSAARGVAHEESDIDLGLFWRTLPIPEEKFEIVERAGGHITRTVGNHLRFEPGNPRQQGWIDIVDLVPPNGGAVTRVDMENETVSGTTQVIADVIEGGDLSLEKQELLAVIQDGIVLYGRDLVDRWREKTGRYPDALGIRMVQGHLLGSSDRLRGLIRASNSMDWMVLFEGLLDIGGRLLLTLMGLNRVWAFTDNPRFKGLPHFVASLQVKPNHFVERLGQALQSPGKVGMQGFAGLIGDVLDLVEAHETEIDLSEERRSIKAVKTHLA